VRRKIWGPKGPFGRRLGYDLREKGTAAWGRKDSTFGKRKCLGRRVKNGWTKEQHQKPEGDYSGGREGECVAQIKGRV